MWPWAGKITGNIPEVASSLDQVYLVKWRGEKLSYVSTRHEKS